MHVENHAMLTIIHLLNRKMCFINQTHRDFANMGNVAHHLKGQQSDDMRLNIYMYIYNHGLITYNYMDLTNAY